MSKPTTLAGCILNMQNRSDEIPAVKLKSSGQWISKSWKEYYNEVEFIGCALLKFGVLPGDRVAIMSNTRFEWAVADLAILGIKAITVPIYQNNTPADVEFILNNSEAKILFCEGADTVKTFNNIREKCPTISQVISFEKISSNEKVLNWDECLQIGRDQFKKNSLQFREICSMIDSSDTATIIYTSGTTGLPKGVVLTHLQAFSEVSEAFPLCGVTERDTSLAFLPFAHVMGRIEHWGHVFTGFTLAYAESIEKIRSNLQDIRPTILVSVPRIFEKIYAGVLAQVQTQPMKQHIFNWAVDVGKKVSDYRLSGQIMPIDLLIKYQVAQKIALSKITAAFGGRLRFAISGGAPLSRDISQFFHAANILILEGYGLSETTAAITVNTPYNYKFGSVGRPFGDTEIKIAEDGEILVRGSKVMKEYYKNEAATKSVFTDGWFQTGDIGELLLSGDLKITDRKKDLIKTAGGKYVAPQKIDSVLKLSPFIAHSHIHGDQKPYIVALLTLNRLVVEDWAKSQNVAFESWDSLVESDFVKNLVSKIVIETNSQLASYESIKKFKILPNEFSIEGGELTPSMKVKRKVLDERFKDLIVNLYN